MAVAAYSNAHTSPRTKRAKVSQTAHPWPPMSELGDFDGLSSFSLMSLVVSTAAILNVASDSCGIASVERVVPGGDGGRDTPSSQGPDLFSCAPSVELDDVLTASAAPMTCSTGWCFVVAVDLVAAPMMTMMNLGEIVIVSSNCPLDERGRPGRALPSPVPSLI